jgi:hypothetical protein
MHSVLAETVLSNNHTRLVAIATATIRGASLRIGGHDSVSAAVAGSQAEDWQDITGNWQDIR